MMAGPSPKRDPVEVLADEFIERCRRGERPTISEYVEGHPALADEIRDLFPVIAAVEGLKVRKEQSADGVTHLGPIDLERLGDFRIIREIGRGGMGIVYEAEQESLSRHVALKVLPRQTLLDSRLLQRFEREARTAARLHHTNIVPVFGVGHQDDYHYYVMQFIRGVGLDEVIPRLREFDRGLTTEGNGSSVESVHARSRRDIQVASVARALIAGQFGRLRENGSGTRLLDEPFAAGTERDVSGLQGNDLTQEGEISTDAADREEPPLSSAAISGVGVTYWQSIANMGLQVANALAYAHAQGTLHRDIKPANLLLDAQGVVWVADFGLAKALEQDGVTQTGDVVGTLRYIAPEQFSGRSDARSDIYSLGLTLYEMLALRPAYEDADRTRLIRQITQGAPAPLRRLNPEIPRDLETIVLKAIAREPAHRYQTAGELVSDLRCFLEDRPILARRTGPLERLWRWSRRNPATAGLAGTALLLMALVAVVATIGYVRTKSANIKAREALARETAQRQKAESTANLMSDALDTIFNRFAPEKGLGASELTVSNDESTQIEVSAQPVLSKETAALLEQMLVFYERLAQQSGGTVGLREKVARANRRIGNIQQLLGNPEQAIQAYLRAVDLFQALDAAFPGNAEVPLETARIQNDLAGAFRELGQQENGEGALSKARGILEPKAKAPSAPPQYRFELARTYFLIGERGRRLGPGPGPPGGREGRRGEGRPGPRHGPSRGVPGRPRRASSRPASRPAESGPIPGPPGDTPGPPFGRHPERDALLGEAIQILDGLVREYPLAPNYRHLLALCYREMSTGRPGHESSAREEAVNRATEILRDLAASFPDVPQYRYDFALTYAMSAHPSPHSDGDPTLRKAAQQRLQTALSIMEKLVDERPNIPDYQMARVHMYHGMARLLRDAGESGRAETDLRKARAIQSELVERFPDVAPYKAMLAMLQDFLAELLMERGQLEEARSLLDDAISLLTKQLNLEEDAKRRRLHGLIGRVYQTLAEVLRRSGKQALAAQAEKQAHRYRDLMPPGWRHRRRGHASPQNQDGPASDSDR